ncbi:MAG: hypothetical protein Q7R77_01010 [Candidatus Daviesbacteria bacterium]|nr:hypothetical protein [Candidatus Daviesbacteria bacterium]
MDENTFRKVVKEVVNETIKPIKEKLDGVTERLDGVTERLDDPDTGLVAINNRLDANTGAVIELEKTVKGYADMYKMNDSNIRRIESRLKPVEKAAKIKVLPELHLESFA